MATRKKAEAKEGQYIILWWECGQGPDKPAGVEYYPNGDTTQKPVRHETGDVVGDLPPGVIKAWTEQGYIAPYTK